MSRVLEKESFGKTGGGRKYVGKRMEGALKEPEKKGRSSSGYTQKTYIPLLLFIWLSLVYYELLLILGNKTPLTPTLLLYVALFSASGAAICYLLSSLSPKRKTNSTILAVIYLLTAVYFGIQFFCKLFFTNYMSVESVFAGTKGVVGGFFGVIVSLVVKNFWMVLLLFVPLAAMLILRNYHLLAFRRCDAFTRIMAGAAAVLFLLAGSICVRLNATSLARYTSNYEFDIATRAFGLGTSTRLDLQYLIFGNKAASDFDYSDPHKPSTPGTSDPVTPVEPNPEDDPPVEPDPEPPVEYGYNAVDIDFQALSENESNSTIASLDRYVASMTPSKQNEYTGLFAGKNLILISAEAFSKEVISEELTPTLYRLATRGIQFNDYYQPAWGGSTSTGEYSNMTGLIPTFGVGSMRNSADKNMYYTLGNQLRRLDYFSRAYHPHTYTYYDRHLTHENLGYDKYIGYGNGLEDYITYTWPESDLELMQATVDAYIDQQPFSIYYMTVSGHANYNWVGNYMSVKNKEAVQAILPDVPAAVQAYLAANLELEYAMKYLVDRLEQAGIADDTVIVLGTDHYPYGLELESSATYRTALGDLFGFEPNTPWGRDHSALIVWSGCLEDRDPIVVDTPVYSLDIVPTLSNLMGLEYDSRLLVGRDVFSDAIPLVIWANYSWKTDKASYDASTGNYTIVEGCEDQVDDAYLSEVRSMVSNKFTFSKNAIDCNYYNVLFG